MSDDSNATKTPGEKVLRAELWISHVLRGGVVVSLILIVLGLSISFVHHPQYVQNREELERLVEPGAAFPRTLPEVARGIASLQGRAIAVSGLLVLILTPILRVAISIVAFIEQGDRRFALITITVILLLALSLVLGAVE
jgi:uncharacterized membrane protein